MIVMTSPLVSIIIPVYNVEAYLEECLDSVVNQTYKNIEVIAVNDGSTDSSPEILNRYKEKYGNIKVINQRNSGPSGARNRGIAEATGKYIYFLDSDDYILPETVENIIGKMEKYELDLVRFGAQPFYEDKSVKIVRNHYDYSKVFQEEKIYNKYEFLRASIKGFAASPWSYIVKAEVLEKHNLQFKPGLLHEDELFTLKLFLYINRAMYDPNLYYMRRYRSGSIMTSIKGKKDFDAYYEVLSEIIKLRTKFKHPDEIRLINKRIRTMYRILMLKQIDEVYKKEMLDRLMGLSGWEKFYITMWHHGAEFVKKLLRY